MNRPAEPALGSALPPPVPPQLPPGFDLEAYTNSLPDSDGEPLETPWHRASMNLLIQVLTDYWHDRTDFFTGGNMFLYFNPGEKRSEDFKGPDFFYVNGVERRRRRRFWAVWKENGRFPNVIIELLSESTATGDRTTKKDLYEKTFRTPEYFCFEPDTFLLEGWRLREGKYEPITPNERGWMWSEELHFWLGTWTGEYVGEQGTYLRYFDAAGKLVPLRVEVEQERAESERQRAEAERQRAEAAEAELARLKARLAKMPSPEQ